MTYQKAQPSHFHLIASNRILFNFPYFLFMYLYKYIRIIGIILQFFCTIYLRYLHLFDLTRISCSVTLASIAKSTHQRPWRYCAPIIYIRESPWDFVFYGLFCVSSSNIQISSIFLFKTVQIAYVVWKLGRDRFLMIELSVDPLIPTC